MGFCQTKLLSRKVVVGISIFCKLALLPDPVSLLSDHVDATKNPRKDIVTGMGPSYFFYTKKNKKVCLLSFWYHCPIHESILWNKIPKQRIRGKFSLTSTFNPLLLQTKQYSILPLLLFDFTHTFSQITN
jgi:hypothetical protein